MATDRGLSFLQRKGFREDMKDQIKIDVTALKDEERNELAKMLFKCGYGIRLTKERITQNRYKYIIVCEKSV
jgi:hypothetical protein